MTLRLLGGILLAHLVISLGLGFSIIFIVMGSAGATPWNPLGLITEWADQISFVLRQLGDDTRRPYALVIVSYAVTLPLLIGLFQAWRLSQGKRIGHFVTALLILVLGATGYFAAHFALDLLLATHGSLTMLKAALMKLGMTMVALWVGIYAVISPLPGLAATWLAAQRRTAQTGPAALAICLAMAALPLAPTQSEAATISLDDCAQGNCGLFGAYLHISGEIVEGDDFDAGMTIQTILDGNDRPLALILDSPGGDAAEAMELGRSVRRLEMTVIVPKGAQCLDLCLAVLAGGVKRRMEGEIGLSGTVVEDPDVPQSNVWMYLREMNVASALSDAWDDDVAVPRIFGASDLEHLGLLAVDPVWQMQMDVEIASDLRTTLAEILARKVRLAQSGRLPECATISNSAAAQACESEVYDAFDLVPR